MNSAVSGAHRGTHDDPLLIDLAFQGGGSHGAFTWGVAERFLDDETLKIESVTGTSAGAMNAAVLAYGYTLNGREGAKAALEQFWRKVSEAARFSPLQRAPIDILLGNWTLDNSPGYVFYDLASRLFSPYDLNPTNVNPLRDILEESIDFERLRQSPIKLFINTTNVRTGLPRVFRNHELSSDVLLASACLPLVHQAVEIDGDAYWDGGFSGNPLLTPIVRESDARDTILVQINPIERPGVPKSARDILNRLNEIAFNASLKKELRGIAMFQRLLRDEGELEHVTWVEAWADMRIHRIVTPLMVKLGASSKLNAEWEFLTLLREEGNVQADVFLRDHRQDIGVRSTYDLDGLLDNLLEQV
ncbi:NTE family protein [Pseudochelatococcus lubricantis]|uniref:NTE family protein n=1 Tax=Pseudochelatococcus lubricantis TaxID=1538102 RepID=A0ABX0UZ16_9HYPH|nr:patatin-like phospholipase family protein [Pseudochelatococcus lubricantis]NIJ58177.1 NTE family protein [Pseudochelatococcus lubricantis]